jgi:hypothetical protein
MMFHSLPQEVLVEMAFQGGACSIFAFLLLVRTASTCFAWRAAIAAARGRIVARFNNRLAVPPAFLYGEHGPALHRYNVGIKGVPVSSDKKLTFEVHEVNDPEQPFSLRIIVVLKVSIIFAPVAGIGATLELYLALRFYALAKSPFNLCAALGWPNGTLQVEHIESEAKQGRFLQPLRKDAFNRHPDNQPQPLHIDWRNPLSKMVVRAPIVFTVGTGDTIVQELVEYTVDFRPNTCMKVMTMRGVDDINSASNFKGWGFDPLPHTWLHLTGLNALPAYSRCTRRFLRLDGSPTIPNNLLVREGQIRVDCILSRHLAAYEATGTDKYYVLEDLSFETDGFIEGKASGLHLMKTFGYLEHYAAHHAAEQARQREMKAAVTALVPQEGRPKRASAVAAEEQAKRQLKLLRRGERQDEPEDGSHLLPAHRQRIAAAE